MNQKEVGELRRRLRPGKNNFSHVYGCYVSPLKEIIAEVDQPLSLLNEDDVESCLALLRKALSGGLGRNLVDVAFSTRQVAESEELKRLLALRDAKLKDAAARREFYETVIQNLELGEDSYLILLAQESYDVPFRTRNDEVLDDSSDTVYSYLLCAVCPMREGKPGLGYVPNENALHVKTAGRPRRRWASCGPPLTTAPPTSIMRCTTCASRSCSTGSSSTGYSGRSRPCPPRSSGRPLRPPSPTPWARSAAWSWCRPSTNSCGSASSSTRRARTQSPWASLWTR